MSRRTVPIRVNAFEFVQSADTYSVDDVKKKDADPWPIGTDKVSRARVQKVDPICAPSPRLCAGCVVEFVCNPPSAGPNNVWNASPLFCLGKIVRLCVLYHHARV